MFYNTDASNSKTASARADSCELTFHSLPTMTAVGDEGIDTVAGQLFRPLNPTSFFDRDSPSSRKFSDAEMFCSDHFNARASCASAPYLVITDLGDQQEKRVGQCISALSFPAESEDEPLF
jgi:hypothetical protein